MSNDKDIYATFYQPDEEPAKSLEPGTMMAGRYRLIERIGRGGMGVVWSAEEKAAERKVVLKFVPQDVNKFDEAVEQLKESFLKIHELHHQHICPVLTLDEEPDIGYFLVMKWLEGETLDQYVKRTVGRQQPLPFDEVLRILRPVAEALDYAHSKRIIHRDIKPSNVFIVLDDEKNIADVQVIDFGLASVIRSSMTRVSQVRFDTSGTRPYMAPEQWKGRPQSGATDQYALAVMAYELLAGYLPFDIDDEAMLRMAVMQDMPDAIDGLPESANDALLKALAKESKSRFETCAEFVAALGGAEIVDVHKDVHRARGVSQDRLVQSLAYATGSVNVAPGVESLMTRGHLALEDSDWTKANKFFDDVLNIDAKYAPAYIGLLCAELQVRNEESLGDYKEPIAVQSNFRKAIRFGNDAYKATLEGYDEKIRERLRQEREERERREEEKRLAEYNRICELTKTASTEEDWQRCADQFRAVRGYKNTAELAEQCDGRALKLKEAERERITRLWQSPAKAGTRQTLSIKGAEYAFRWCPEGTFTMGSPTSEADRDNNETQHQVTLSRGFWMLETQVTQAMWESVMGNNPSNFKGSKKLPVEQVSWDDCQVYIKKLNGLNIAPTGFKFSLPTESQWEYACRAGTTTPFNFGGVLNGDKANCNGNYPYGTTTMGKYLKKTTNVGSYPANAWGLLDMHGNVLEWCLDWFGGYPSGNVTDPVGVPKGSRRVVRGGSWYNDAGRCRSALRDNCDPSFRSNITGLRLSLVFEG